MATPRRFKRDERNRYAIGFRIHQMIEQCKARSYSIPELSESLRVSKKTVYRMIAFLESAGIAFYIDDNKRRRILK